jgi:hypothetical protein
MPYLSLTLYMNLVLHGMDSNKARGLKDREYKDAMKVLIDKYLPMKSTEDVVSNKLWVSTLY